MEGGGGRKRSSRTHWSAKRSSLDSRLGRGMEEELLEETELLEDR